MANEPVQIIYLNGPSSSGKTTLAKALQHAFEEPFLHVGIDKIIGWMPEKINDWTGGEAPLGYSWKKSVDVSGNPIQELQAGSYAQKIGKTFQEVVHALAKMGHYIVIDDVSFGKQQLDEWKKALEGFQVLWVGVNAPLPVLEQREKERGNRILGSARGQFHKVHVDASYDLEIDTHQASIGENVEKIKSLALCSSRLMEASTKNLIRPMNAHDIAKIVSRYSFPWSTPEKTKVLWDTYYREQQDNIRTVAVLEKDNEILGYGSLLRKPESPFFADKNIPEINAIWIDENHRRQGLGKALIKWLEDLANQEGYDQIGIGVGLYRDYGPAQKLYFQLGYAPDGNGITYKSQSTTPGQTYPLDDDLILWLPAGGHVEPNEHPRETVKREILEELGIEADFMMVDPLFLTVTKTVGQSAGHTDISLWYILNGFSSVSYAFDAEEFVQIRWFSLDQIPYNQSDPHMKRCIEKLCSLSILEKKELRFTDV